MEHWQTFASLAAAAAISKAEYCNRAFDFSIFKQIREADWSRNQQNQREYDTEAYTERANWHTDM